MWSRPTSPTLTHLRLALALSALFVLAACASDPPPDPAVSGTDVATPDPAPLALSAADLEGDWVYCDGPTSLDTDVSFEGGRVSTYIDDRPGVSGDYAVEGTDLVVRDVRYAAGVAGSVLTLTASDGASDGAAVYARTESACPAGPPQTAAPEGGAAVRSEILDIARTEVRKSGLAGEVDFQEPWLRQSGDWAFLEVEFRRPNGGFIYDTDPSYCDADAQVKLLLRSVNGSWEVVSGGGDEGAYCVSDFAGYGHYVDDFGEPRSIFPESPY